MNDRIIYFILGGFVLLGVLGIFALPAISDIPPTAAFFAINGTDGSINATTYRQILQLVEGANIDFDFDNALKKWTISASGGNATSPNELYCILGEWFSSYNGTTGNFDCTRVPVYENNTASNLSPGTGLFASKSGVDLRFKSLAGGTGITLSNNATTVLITNTGTGENTTATNLGTSGHGVYESEVSDQLRFKKIACVGLTCTNNSTNIILTVTSGVSDGDKGDITVTSSGATWTIDNDVVTYAKMQNVAGDDRFLGRISGASGDTEELTGTQATSLLDVFTTSLKGLAPSSGGGTTNFLRADGTWAAPPSGGGITTLGADSTCTATATYCTVWTIPLTASSGNYLDVNMVGDSNTANGAIQMRVQFDNAGNNGYCTYRTYTSATAETLDVLAATAATDTGETLWIAGANIPMPLNINCAFETDASPGNALVQIQMEVASTGTIQKGSYYIKTP